MIDFNDTTQTAKHDRESQRDEIRAELIARLDSVLTTMFPAGKKRRGKFLIGDILGSPGDSLEVVLEGEKAGLWTDRATGDGGDIFALIAAYLGTNIHTDFPRVLDEAADLLGRSRSVPVRKAKMEAPVDDLGPVPDDERQPDARMLPLERGEQAGCEVLGRADSAEGDVTALPATQGAQLVRARADLSLDPASRRQHQGAGLRDLLAAATALEEGQADLAFE